MFPYLLLLTAAGVVGAFYCGFQQERGKKDFVYLLIFTVLMVGMAVLRAPTVGIDYPSYVDIFRGYAANDFSYVFDQSNYYWKEPGYGLLNFLFTRVSDNEAVFMALIPALIIILRSIAIWRMSKSIWISVFVYISFGFFGYAMCTLRQELAISIAMFALPYLRQRKLLPYLLIVVLAALFHSSAWFFVPVYWLVKLPLNWKTYILYGVGTVFVLIFSEPILGFVTQFIFKDYQLGTYFLQGRNVNTALMIVAFCAVFILAKNQLLQRSKENLIDLNLYLYATILFIWTLKHFVFQRVGLLFLPIAVFLIPELIMSCLPEKKDYQLLSMTMEQAKKKGLQGKYQEEKRKYDGEKSLFYTVLGLTILGCVLYQLFLLSANRLNLVPYELFF